SDALRNWQEVVRNSPYWVSQGVYNNLVNLRRWVLKGEGYCERKNRHILFDRRATFLGYLEDSESIATTQAQLNHERRRLAEAGRVDYWTPGDDGQIGYPFALSCNQPHAQMEHALARYTGEDTSARLWGTWDGMSI